MGLSAAPGLFVIFGKRTRPFVSAGELKYRGTPDYSVFKLVRDMTPEALSTENREDARSKKSKKAHTFRVLIKTTQCHACIIIYHIIQWSHVYHSVRYGPVR